MDNEMCAHQRGVNRILSLLPDADRVRIAGSCEKVSLDIGTVLYKAGGVIDAVHFPLDGMVSLVIGIEEGATVEVGVVGNEGIVGNAIALGAERSHVKALVQVKSEFLRMERKDFLAELKVNDALVALVDRFSQALTSQTSQLMLCNCSHSVEERVCRWLLMTHDRAGSDQIQLTLHLISQMLGVGRSSVTVAAVLLQKAGFIDYSRGSVKVLDRAALEDSACECYAIVSKEINALLVG